MRTVVVTGGAKGIGKAVAERFAGDRVEAGGRDMLDVTDEDAVAAFFERIGAVDVLVNNAGVAEGAPVARTSLESWRHHFEVNATGAFLCTRAVLPVCSSAGRGGSSPSRRPPACAARYTAAYTAAKHAAVGLMQATGSRGGRHGRDRERRLPGWVRTAMMERAVERITATTDRDEQQAEAALVAQMPLGARSSRRRSPRPSGSRLPGGGGDQRAGAGARMSPFRASAAITEEWKNFDFASTTASRRSFSRPDKLNALTFDVYADLRDLLAELPHRGDVRVLVLTGEGRGFCSGGDVEEIIGELQGMEAAQLLEFTRMSGAVVKAMRDAPIPIIAAVNGVAAGAGAVLALARTSDSPARRRSSRSCSQRGPGRRRHGRHAAPAARGSRTGNGAPDPGRRSRRRSCRRDRAWDSRGRPGRRDSRSWPGGWPTVTAWRTRRRKCSSSRARPRPGRRDRDGGTRPGAADEGRGLPRVLRRLVGGADVIVNPPGLPEPSGYAHAVVAGGAIYLGGQIGEGATVVEQFDSAAAEIVVALRAAGGERAPRLDGGLHDRNGGVPGIARRARSRLAPPFRPPLPRDGADWSGVRSSTPTPRSS